MTRVGNEETFDPDEVRVLVCGSRTWTDQWIVDRILDGIYDYYAPKFVLIDGCANGADAAAERWHAHWARDEGPDRQHFPANWDLHGKAAGPIRNQQMLDEGTPNVVIAFTDDLANSKGTKDMVTRAKKAGIPTYVVSHA